uniref:VWFA domain-containing protein n=1 Tax=Chromera velia CCMP2878 TaxID=1169474 RepID=A0A0G4HQL4_9ALVE|eukprot:Cvel_7996.t1-p1 / transcript=Cvel_7996.t1 / gene=Cvel_7996 / organism=Chromera_velia_CCMP2878 / gene_product=hypothetical protein / transcript_product=hypothetical protein / location=Cvel_scaffold431:3988-5886(-) / protein_length=633 / sequence_SO=supercontig / SO=protein_coding / is_pseudo=false
MSAHSPAVVLAERAPQECGANGAEVYFLVDVSYSMEKRDADMVKGFNAFLFEQRQRLSEEYPVKVSIALFNTQIIQTPTDRTPILMVPDLAKSKTQYQGCTRLFDCIGQTIKSIDSYLDTTFIGQDCVRPQVILAILTDGADNKSTVYTADRIREMIRVRESLGWFCVVIGIGGDAEYLLLDPKEDSKAEQPTIQPHPANPHPTTQTATHPSQTPGQSAQGDGGPGGQAAPAVVNASNVSSGLAAVNNLLNASRDVNKEFCTRIMNGERLLPSARRLVLGWEGRRALEGTEGIVVGRHPAGLSNRPAAPIYPLPDTTQEDMGDGGGGADQIMGGLYSGGMEMGSAIHFQSQLGFSSSPPAAENSLTSPRGGGGGGGAGGNGLYPSSSQQQMHPQVIQQGGGVVMGGGSGVAVFPASLYSPQQRTQGFETGRGSGGVGGGGLVVGQGAVTGGGAFAGGQQSVCAWGGADTNPVGWGQSSPLRPAPFLSVSGGGGSFETPPRSPCFPPAAGGAGRMSGNGGGDFGGQNWAAMGTPTPPTGATVGVPLSLQGSPFSSPWQPVTTVSPQGVGGGEGSGASSVVPVFPFGSPSLPPSFSSSSSSSSHQQAPSRGPQGDGGGNGNGLFGWGPSGGSPSQ